MGRSPYDAPPSYKTCRHCGTEYDGGGYYGSDDESHYCREKALVALRFIVERFPDVEGLLHIILTNIADEQRAAQALRAHQERERLEALLRQRRDEIATIEAELAAYKAGPA